MAGTTKPKDDKQSTDAIPREAVLVGYQVKRPKYEVKVVNGKKKKVRTGGYATVRGSLYLFLPTKLISRFNIPTSAVADTTTANLQLTKVDDFSKNFYTSIDDTTATPVSVTGHTRLKGSLQRRGRRKVKSVLVPLGENLKTPKGNLRMVSIPFPSWFNFVMIAQLLGQMMANATASKKPRWFQTENGVRYAISYGQQVQGDNPIPGATSGAWVAQAVIPPSNVDNPDDIPSDSSVVGSGGDRNG